MSKLKRPGARRGLRVGGAILALAGVGSLLAFKTVFPHSGEQALILVPSSAAVVGTVDLDPAPSQALTFARIWSALQQNGLATSLQALGKDIDKESPGVQELWDISKHSASFCYFASADKKSIHGALLIPVTDGQKAQTWLTDHGKPQTFQGTSFYATKLAIPDATLEGDTLILSDTPWVLHEMAKVPAGQEKPVTQMPGYAEARAKAPSDATILCITTPNIADLSSGVVAGGSVGWMTNSLTIQSDGIAISSNGKVNPVVDPTMAALASVKPLRPDLLQVLPAGAYSVYAQSQPGQPTFAALQSAVTHDKDVAKMAAEIKKSSGIDLPNDLRTAFQGDLVVATYPSQDPTSGLDFLLVTDNQNGADPGVLAAKLQTVLDKTINPKNAKKRTDWYTQVPRNDGVEYKIPASLERKVRSWDWVSSRSNVLLSDKTVVWATVGGNEFIATSQPLLDQAIASYGGRAAKSLAGDPSVVSGLTAPATDQAFTVADLSRVATGVRNTFDDSKMDPTGRNIYNLFLNSLTGLDKPLRMETSVARDGTCTATGFIPVDYPKLIDFIGAVKKWSDTRDSGKGKMVATPAKNAGLNAS